MIAKLQNPFSFIKQNFLKLKTNTIFQIKQQAVYLATFRRNIVPDISDTKS